MADEERGKPKRLRGGDGLPPEVADVPEDVVARQELLTYVRPNTEKGLAPTTKKFLRRQAKLAWHRAVAWYQRRSIWERGFYMVAYLTLPVASAIHIGITKSTAGALTLLIVLQGRKAWMEFSPKHLRVVERNYVERKLRLTLLLEQMHPGAQFSDREIQKFREDALRLVAMYVRDYRYDLVGKKIFVNLLIEDGDDIVVLARNESHRLPQARYPKAQMTATRVFQTGEPMVIGDLYNEVPGCVPGKKYNSILALPVTFDSRIVGVLSIDSEVKYHFDDESEALMDYLSPYIAVLAWTLAPRYVRAVAVEGGDK